MPIELITTAAIIIVLAIIGLSIRGQASHDEKPPTLGNRAEVPLHDEHKY
jgi:hypothetical protein